MYPTKKYHNYYYLLNYKRHVTMKLGTLQGTRVPKVLTQRIVCPYFSSVNFQALFFLPTTCETLLLKLTGTRIGRKLLFLPEPRRTYGHYTQPKSRVVQIRRRGLHQLANAERSTMNAEGRRRSTAESSTTNAERKNKTNWRTQNEVR